MQLTTNRKNKGSAADVGEEPLLGSFEVFRGLSSSDVNRIIGAGVIRSLDRGRLLFRKGDIGEDVFLVLKGMVQIIDEYEDHKKAVAELGPGEFFGEMSMFEKAHRRSVHAVVKEPSQILVLRNNILNKLIDDKMPKRFLKNIIGMLCGRIHTNKSLYMRARYDGKSSRDVIWQG
jgi:CRP-like cAMP-binding protein